MEDILDKLITKDDLDSLAQEVELLQTHLYKDDFDDVVNNQVRRPVASLFSEKTKDEIEKILNELRMSLEKFVEVSITLAIYPTNTIVWEIYDFLKNNINKSFVIDFKKENIIGGCVISVKGEYRDVSLKRHFDALLNDNPQGSS